MLISLSENVQNVHRVKLRKCLGMQIPGTCTCICMYECICMYMYMNTIMLHMPPVQITTPSPWYYIPDETGDEVMDCTQTAAGFVYYTTCMCGTCSRELNVCVHTHHTYIHDSR